MIDPNIGGWQSVKAKLKAVIKFANKLENLTIQRSGTTDSVTQAGESISINVAEFPTRRKGVSSSGDTIHAFQLVKVAADTLCVRQGTISSVIPTITGGAELATDYKDNELDMPGTGTREYWLKITRVEGGDVTAVTIEESEPDNVSATQAEILLGSVETDSGDIVAFSSNLSGSQALASCGANHYFGVV